MRYLAAAWLVLVSSLALGQSVTPVQNCTTVTTSGTQAVSGNFDGDVIVIYTVGAVTGGGSIVFQVCSTDPLAPTLADGGPACITTVTGPSISTATPASALKLHAGHSSSVNVTWFTSGSFSANVCLSSQGVAPGEIQGFDGGYPVAVTGSLTVSPSSGTFSSEQCSQVTCGSASATQLPGDAGMIGWVIGSWNPLGTYYNLGPCVAADAGTATPYPTGATFSVSGNVSANECCEVFDAGVTISACVVWP